MPTNSGRSRTAAGAPRDATLAAAANFVLHVRPVGADAWGGGFADEGGDAMSTVAGETTTTYVVRGADGHVVVAFWGELAPEEADRWLERDYRVDRVQLPVE